MHSLCRLLLPYECHVKGILMKTLPHHQPKQFHYPGYSKDDDDDGQRPAKRKMISIQLPQVGKHSNNISMKNMLFPFGLT